MKIFIFHWCILFHWIYHSTWWFVEAYFACFANTDNKGMNIFHKHISVLHVSMSTFLSVPGQMSEEGIFAGVYFFNSTGSCPIIVQNGCIKSHTYHQYVSSYFYILSIVVIIRVLPVCRYVKLTQVVLMRILWFSVWFSILKFLYEPSMFHFNAVFAHVIFDFIMGYFPFS